MDEVSVTDEQLQNFSKSIAGSINQAAKDAGIVGYVFESLTMKKMEDNQIAGGIDVHCSLSGFPPQLKCEGSVG